MEYPAAYGEVIAVGSVDNMGNRSEGSAVGDALELVAPGELVLSTGAFYGVAVFSGTSMAAPHVAGIASLLWEKDPDCSADFIRFLLASTANLYGNPEEYGNGVVDYEAAVSRYEALKDAYEELEASGTVTADYVGLADRMQVEYNDSEIDVFEDLDYVEGSWKEKKHRELTNEALNGILEYADLAIVKMGAVAPDEYIEDMRVNPEWHGFTWYQLGANNGKGLSNYISSYIYLTRIAAAVSRGEGVETAKPVVKMKEVSVANIRRVFLAGNKGLYNYEFDDESGEQLSKIEVPWDEILKTKNNTHFRSLFIYGMALHTMTDMFAHSVCTEEHGYLSHEEGSDETDVAGNRLDCCVAMIKKSVEHLKGDKLEPATVADYAAMLETYDKSFKLNRFMQFMTEVDEAYFNQNINLFKSICNDYAE